MEMRVNFHVKNIILKQFLLRNQETQKTVINCKYWMRFSNDCIGNSFFDTWDKIYS